MLFDNILGGQNSVIDQSKLDNEKLEFFNLGHIAIVNLETLLCPCGTVYFSSIFT